MSKRELLIVTISTFIGALIASFFVLYLFKFDFEVGSVADWFGAIATTAAVIVALLPMLKRKKPRLVFGEKLNIDEQNYGVVCFTYSNLSEIPGEYILRKSEWLDEKGGWHEYEITEYAKKLIVQPFEQEKEIPYSSDGIDPSQFWGMDFKKGRLTYVDQLTKDEAILYFKRSKIQNDKSKFRLSTK